MQKKIKLQILLTFFVLILVILFFQYSDFDILFQDNFFDFNTSNWFIDKNDEILRTIFYTGIKKVLIVISILFLILFILSFKSQKLNIYKKGFLLVFLSLIFVPLSISSLKAITNTPCPKNIEHFGGDYPDIKVFDSYPKDFQQKNKVRCWPAGHASGGFALMSLFFLFKSKSNKYLALFGSLILGWSMGIYKMLIGDHFLSHTIITMIMAYFVILTIKYILDNIFREKIEESTKI